MPQGVSCSVSNCAFWDKGNRCGAREIAIEIDGHADANKFGEEFSEELFEGHQDHADRSSGTCCLTFQPKDKDDK